MQLAVKLAGFAIALPLVLAAAGGWSARRRGAAPTTRRTGRSGGRTSPSAIYLALLAPAFIVSPGLLQKMLGARDDRAVRLGVGLNALGLLLYAGVPVLLGIACARHVPAARRQPSWRCR